MRTTRQGSVGRSSQSRVVGVPLANTTSIVTPTSRKKRTVLHTPAIIETIIQQPDYTPIPIRPPAPVTLASIAPVSRGPYSNFVSSRATTIPATRQSHLSKIRTAFPLRSGYDSRSFGVKVTQDLRSIRPPTIDEDYEGDCCTSTLVSTIGFCRLFRCPFWICCLLPILILGLLIGGSYLLSKTKPDLVYNQDNLQRLNKGLRLNNYDEGQKGPTQSVANEPWMGQTRRRQDSPYRRVSKPSKGYNRTLRSGVQTVVETEIVDKNDYTKYLKTNNANTVNRQIPSYPLTPTSELTPTQRQTSTPTQTFTTSTSSVTSSTKLRRTNHRPTSGASKKYRRTSSRSQYQSMSAPSLIVSLLRSRLAPTFQQSQTARHLHPQNRLHHSHSNPTKV